MSAYRDCDLEPSTGAFRVLKDCLRHGANMFDCRPAFGMQSVKQARVPESAVIGFFDCSAFLENINADPELMLVSLKNVY